MVGVINNHLQLRKRLAQSWRKFGENATAEKVSEMATKLWKIYSTISAVRLRTYVYEAVSPQEGEYHVHTNER